MKKNKRTIKKYWYGIVGGVALLLLGGGVSAHAETEFMTSWQARTYVPAWYEGRVLPTYESPITIAFELLEDGKIVDLSNTAVRWYVDGRLLKNELNGLGIKKILVINKKYGGDTTEIRISIPNYKGGSQEKLINIPIKTPEAVIEAPYFKKKVEKGVSTLRVWPFFFNTTNASNLSLKWVVDGSDVRPQNANDTELEFVVGNDTSPGRRSTIEAQLVNPRKAMENIKERIFLEVL